MLLKHQICRFGILQKVKSIPKISAEGITINRARKVWEDSLDKEQVELWARGIIGEILASAVQQVEGHKTAGVFAQLDTHVRDWLLWHNLPLQSSRQWVQVQVH